MDVIPQLLALIAASVLPSMLWVLYIVLQDVYEPEPASRILAFMGIGALAVAPAYVLELGLLHLMTDPGDTTTWFHLLTVGPVEESVKFSAAFWLLRRTKDFDEPMDALVYCGCAAIGFAVAENLVYGWRHGEEVAVGRALFAVPGHFLLSGLYGFTLGLRQAGRGSRDLVLASLVGASLLHGLSNVLALEGWGQYHLLLLGGLWLTHFGFTRQLLLLSPFRPTHRGPLRKCPDCRTRLLGARDVCPRCGTILPVPMDEDD